MVNDVIYNYLKVNKEKYPIDDLKKEIISKGYKPEEFDEVLLFIKSSEPKKFQPGSLHQLPSSNFVGDNKKKGDFGAMKLLLILVVILLFGFGIIVLFNFFDIPFFGFNLFNFFS